MLVLPTKAIPTQLQNQIKKQEPIRKILNGYRNKLTQQKKLILIKNQNYAGQAYCYTLVDQPDIQLIKSYQTKDQIVESVERYWVVIGKGNVSRFDFLRNKLSIEEFNRILGELGSEDSSLAAKNLFLNIFDSHQELQKSGLTSLIFTQNIPNKNQPVIEQQTMIEKFYSGDNLFEVPTYNSKSGDWNPQKTIVLKFSMKNKDVKVEQKQQKNKQELKE